MVGKKLIARSGLIGALCLPMSPVMAQETGGVRIIVGVEQGLDLGRNTTLSVPATGERASATTRLSFGIISETRTQSLRLDAESAFRFESISGEASSAFDAPALTLAYARQGAQASLNVSASYAQQDIETLRSLSAFIDEDGVFVLPEDFADLTGTGQRTTYDARAALVLGRDAPLGFQFDLGASGTTYQDTTDPGLTDTKRTNLGASARLQLSAVLTGTISLSYATFEEDNAVQTERTTRDLDFGLTYLISPRATLDAAIGSTSTDTSETTGDTRTQGLTGRIALGYDMPNGTANAVLDASRDASGDQRLGLQFGRSLELPAGRLSGTLGVTRPENDDVSLIGSIDWFQELPTGSFSVRLNRSVAVAADDETRLTTLASARYSYDINSLSSLSLGLSYVVADATSTTNRVTQTDATATYSYALTRDWNLNTGVSYRVRDETTVGRASSPVLSVSIGRDFEFLR